MDPTLNSPILQSRDPWQWYIDSPPAFAPASQVSELDFSIRLKDNPFVTSDYVHEELKLPDLETLQYGALEALPTLDESLATEDDDDAASLLQPTRAIENEVGGLWSLGNDDFRLEHDRRHYNWEAFQSSGQEAILSTYLSEAGTDAFNVALYLQENVAHVPSELPVLKKAVFLESIFALGLGRSSSLFPEGTEDNHASPRFYETNLSGTSKQATSSIIMDMVHCGRLIRYLRDFSDRTYDGGKAYPAKVALAKSITVMIDAMELQLVHEFRRSGSLLQLQYLFQRPHRMLLEVYDLAKTVRTARSDEDLASLVYKKCQYCDQEPGWLRSIMLEILARVSRPWLELVEQWVGIKHDLALQIGERDTTFVSLEQPPTKKGPEEPERATRLFYTFRPENLPLFISQADGKTIFDIGRDIRLLREHHPDHPLSQSQTALEEEICLKWEFDWQLVDRIALKAKHFETALAGAVKQFQEGLAKRHGKTSRSAPHNHLENDCFDHLALDSAGIASTPTSDYAKCSDELSRIVTDSILYGESDTNASLAAFCPPIAVTPLLSFNPILLAQQRVLNAVILRLIFRSHHLRLHLDLQRSFHMLGDGVFVSRLTSALFNPEQSTTERQRGVMRTGSDMGLRLGCRGTWPPASSELQLAVMGILNDCCRKGFAHRLKQAHPTQNRDLPGSLSFAIRQLSEEEAEKILDANSLHALDFLRLHYSPPSPLGAILTPTSLERYDTIFKFLRRLARLQFVVAHLPKEHLLPQSRLFCWQAESFVSTCCRYFFDTGVRETWTSFMQYLDEVEQRLKEEDEAGELGTRYHEGVDDMRKQHDICLERITFALLLRTRQQKVMKVLEDILATILDFAGMCHTSTGTMNAEVDRANELYASFHRNVKLFIEVCRGLNGKRGYGQMNGDARGTFNGRNSSAEENTIERLVVALDFNGFYERRS